MSRLATRSLGIVVAIVVLGLAVSVLAVTGLSEWALAIAGVLVAMIGVALVLHAAESQKALRHITRAERSTRREISQLKTILRAQVEEVTNARDETSALSGEVASLRREIVATQLQRAGAALTPVPMSAAATSESRKSLGLVGFFGHGNYGDELFIDVFQQFLGTTFALSIIPDLERKPYFSRPIKDKVAEVDAIVMGGGDLIQRWNTDPRYFDPTYLRKPFYMAGVGVPIYRNLPNHEEKPHIVNRLRRFFNDPNVRMIGLRDDFSADWVREKLEPSAPVSSEPDIVCSLDLPTAVKPVGAPVLGIVTRQRRVETPDDYSRLEELGAHAQQRGFRVRHIILGTGTVGERDLANAPALRVPDKEVVSSESLDDLSRAIGECTVLASMKFHGTVVATMYGVPSIVLVPTNKNRNFMARIGRDDLVASHDSDRLVEIFGETGPEPIDPDSVAMLRKRSMAFMEKLRDELIEETRSTAEAR